MRGSIGEEDLYYEQHAEEEWRDGCGGRRGQGERVVCTINEGEVAEGSSGRVMRLLEMSKV